MCDLERHPKQSVEWKEQVLQAHARTAIQQRSGAVGTSYGRPRSPHETFHSNAT